jgi:hypothetical protein
MYKRGVGAFQGNERLSMPIQEGVISIHKRVWELFKGTSASPCLYKRVSTIHIQEDSRGMSLSMHKRAS